MPCTLALAFAAIPLPPAFELPVPPLRTEPLRKKTAESEHRRDCHPLTGTFGVNWYGIINSDNTHLTLRGVGGPPWPYASPPPWNPPPAPLAMPCTPERGVDAPDDLPPAYWLPLPPLPARRGVDTSPLPVRRGVDAPEAGCPDVDGRRGVDAPDAEAVTKVASQAGQRTVCGSSPLPICDVSTGTGSRRLFIL
jgi:hypothetical protein